MKDILDLVYLWTHKKACDTVDHEILLSKLDYCSIQGISITTLPS